MLATHVPLRHGALVSLGGLRRWSSRQDSGTSAENAVLDQHYMKMLSIEACLALAGFDATQWHEYLLPRSRGTSVNDPDAKWLIEFFFPELYKTIDRVAAAYESNPHHRDDPISVTNFRFVTTIRELTLFWLQDSVIMLKEYEELACTPPWSTMLKHTEAKRRFDSFAVTVRT